MKTFKEIVEQARQHIDEKFPWDIDERVKHNPEILLIDIREETEFFACHIKNSLLIPRGILETACEAEYEEGIDELINARDKEVVIFCRSGNRSVLATQRLQTMGYNNICSMKTGLRGWNDYELPLFDKTQKQLDLDSVDELLNKPSHSRLLKANCRGFV